MAAKSAKQKVASLLMRHHYIWNEKTPTGKLKKPWRSDYRAWLDEIASLEVVNELVRWIWAISRMVEDEQAA